MAHENQYANLEMLHEHARRMPRLTAEQEATLAAEIQAGSKRAADRLAECNLALVLQMARKHARRGAGHNLDDLVSEGLRGLVEAARTFDPNKGRFTTHAHPWIRARILDYIMVTARPFRIATTGDKRKLFWGLRKTRARLEAQGIEATPEALSEALGVPVETVVAFLRDAMTVDVSTDVPVGDDPDGATVGAGLAGDIPDPGQVWESCDFHRELQEKIERFRAELSDKEKVVLDHRILSPDPLPMREVGAMLGGTSRQGVDQIEKRILVKLRSRLQGLYREICNG